MKQFLLLLNISLIFGELISPYNGALLNHTHVLFEWTQTPEATHYEFQLSEDPDFSNPILNIEDNSLIIIERDVIDWNGTYYWRVRPIYQSQQGSWTDPFLFTTGSSLSSSTVDLVIDDQIQPGITVFGAFFNYFSAAIDHSGREIWNSGENDLVYYSTSKYGNILGCYLMPESENNLPGLEMSFEGDTLWEEPNNEFLHHDLILLPNGNYLGIVETSSLGPIPVGSWTSSFQGLGFQADGITIEFPWIGDQLIEWDRDTKDVVWTWNVFDHYDMQDYDQLGGTWTEAYISLHYDWTHVNAVIFDEDESALYISTRHLSRITKIDYPSGDIIWNMGHQMSSNDINMGTDLGFSFQHSLQKLENGNILTFDNGNLAPEFRGTDEPISRAIEISIDGSDASLAWSYELAPDLFGFASGNAQKLDNGNVLLTTVGGGGRSLEVDVEGNIVWEGLYNLSLPDGAVYRANRISGIFPAAYSVLINNYMESEGVSGIYIPPGSSSISYTIMNEGDHSLSLSCQISDDEGWFNSQNVDLVLEAGMSEQISFNGEVTEIENGNVIHLLVLPINHPHRSKTISVEGYTTQLNLDKRPLPNSYTLAQPYPNPFNPSISINFSLEKDQSILLQIYDMKGQLVSTLIDKKVSSGNHTSTWRPYNTGSGVYFIQLTNGNTAQTEKVIYLK